KDQARTKNEEQSTKNLTLFLHPRAEPLQPLDDSGVAAFDRLERLDRAHAVGRERRGDERHARPQVAAVERTSLQLLRAGDDDAMRIAEEQRRAHAAQLLEREEAQFVEPVVDQRL